jgi:hypothetical protein
MLPGDLPGDTGWPRPKATKSHLYHLVHSPAKVVAVKEDWTVQIECDACKKDQAYFYARAYGPAVLSGNVKRIGDGVYDISFRFLDAGMYTVEVVMEYSDLPDFAAFPLPNGVEEPGYEGLALPGFPTQLQVKGPQIEYEVDGQRNCTRKDLTDPIPNARWKIVETVEKPRPTLTGDAWVGKGKQPRSLLGIYMAYEFENCRLLPKKELSAKLSCAYSLWRSCTCFQI